MLKIIDPGTSMPYQWLVDPSATFQPGMVGQLKSLGNNIVCGVSDGSAPIGIIDDIKTNAFTANVVNEVQIIPIQQFVIRNGARVTAVDTKEILNNANIFDYSFVANIPVALLSRNGVAVNGVILIPAGTPLNFDADGDGEFDSVRVVVSYTYQVPNIPGDDSTAGSGKVTIWFQRFIFSTDQFETNQNYAINSPLFVSENGLLTSRQIDSEYPAIALVTAPPNAILGTLEALFL